MMKSGEFEALYKKWFQSPIPPKGINLNAPMSKELIDIARELEAHARQELDHALHRRLVALLGQHGVVAHDQLTGLGFGVASRNQEEFVAEYIMERADHPVWVHRATISEIPDLVAG